MMTGMHPFLNAAEPCNLCIPSDPLNPLKMKLSSCPKQLRTFDVGMDLGSPVSLLYQDPAASIGDGECCALPLLPCRVSQGSTGLEGLVAGWLEGELVVLQTVRLRACVLVPRPDWDVHSYCDAHGP